ncbi:uncharacterized protein K444DRAFT_722078 [Hyaloscypha bicolor E]|uniref:Uncharacterized protein n=1 Tax=Hyaloscypha bicolor E TaxID=1095630 RepID=A0A2J6TAW6_9HELO|nr:uncharacterized protein K444DRAFT_722078 [Hyaloscypha bicolor E]PMD60165.1 hypothetical protein K444DRAFT_722078 [Hyaloscypha bicolor E]
MATDQGPTGNTEREGKEQTFFNMIDAIGDLVLREARIFEYYMERLAELVEGRNMDGVFQRDGCITLLKQIIVQAIGQRDQMDEFVRSIDDDINTRHGRMVVHRAHGHIGNALVHVDRAGTLLVTLKSLGSSDNFPGSLGDFEHKVTRSATPLQAMSTPLNSRNLSLLKKNLVMCHFGLLESWQNADEIGEELEYTREEKEDLQDQVHSLRLRCFLLETLVDNLKMEMKQEAE